MAFLQKIDNQYNIRGWLTKINDPSLNGENDLFGMQLCYETTAALGGLNNTTGYYNGNLVGLKWSTREGSVQTKAYRFSYDALNRLRTSSYAEGSVLNEKMGFFDENINEYDKNGNIKSLSRKFNNDLVDNLNYTYIPNTNQILSISDAGLTSGLVEDYPETSGTYAYDANGNVIHDGSRSTTIDYFKTLNIPKSVDFGSDNQIFYHYSATGSKLVKHVQKPDGQEYVQYVGNIVYEEGKLSYIITEEGRLVNTGTTGSPAFVSEYYLKDHLGNTRVSFLGKTLPGNAIEITGKTDYYPFGLAMSQYSTNIGSDYSKNKYLYNGKEIQDDKLNGTFFGWLDYGARFYDPQIGRWHSIDFKAESYIYATPYSYVLSNPTNLIDPNGMEVTETDWGYKYTGSDAVAAFNAINSKNLYISIVANWEAREGTNSALGQSTHGQWNVFAAGNLREALFLTRFISDRYLTNLVLDAHSTRLKSKDGKLLNIGISLTVPSKNKDDARYVYFDINDNGKFKGNIPLLTEDFSELLDKLADNGTFVTNACNLGEGEFGRTTLEGLNKLTGNRGITFLLNMYKGAGEQIHPGYENLGIDPNGSLSHDSDKRDGFIGFKGGKIFYVNDVYISSKKGTKPIQLK